MKLRSLLILGIGVVAGIYFSVQEEENKKIGKTKSRDLKKVVDSMILKLEDLFNQTKDLKSDEIRINLKERIENLKNNLNNLSGKTITETTKLTLQKIAKGIRKITNEIEEWTNKSNKKDIPKKALPRKKT